MLAKIELFVLKVIESKTHKACKAFLYILSLAYRLISLIQSCHYKIGWKKSVRMPVPIVCIGNITAGGTGKTPFVQMLAKDLQDHLRLAIVSTAYRSKGVTKDDVITPQDRQGRKVAAQYCGDEPAQLHQHLPTVSILLSKDRMKAVKVAHAQGAQLVLLDDGLQHRSIMKNITVVVVSAKDPMGLGYYLPRGLLRESPRQLKHADFLCITGVGLRQEEFEEVSRKLNHYSKARVIGAEIRPLTIKGDTELELGQLKGKKIGAFCGIGRPQNYMQSLQGLGVEIVAKLVIPDHCSPSPKEWKSFMESSVDQGAELVLCTEKDFVKIQGSHYNSLPISYVESELKVVYGRDHYKALQDHIIQLTKACKVGV